VYITIVKLVKYRRKIAEKISSMKRWFSGKNKKLHIGITAVVALAGFVVASGLAEQRQYEANLDTGGLQSAPAPSLNLGEKQKISVTRTEIVTTEENVPFITTETYDGVLAKDTAVVRVEGRNGKKLIKTEVKTKDGVEISRSLVSEEVTVPPVSKVVAIGTKVIPQKKKEVVQPDCEIPVTGCEKETGRGQDCRDDSCQDDPESENEREIE
jgi:hypothetical protein